MASISSSSTDSESSSTFSRPNLLELFETFLSGIEPFYGGKSTIPAYQTSLYYTCPSPEGDVHRRIDFSKAGADDLAALYAACKPAAFGLNGETVHDDTYRKAKKMDLDAFATQFDPRSIGILERVSRVLLTGKRGQGITETELYKLNVYGKGDFFKPHQDTPRSESMVGSLVVVLPTRHEGGQLVLRHDKKEWTLDFADTLAAATEPTVCFAAFFGDVEHQVLPVTSGYRVTLTYNLYHKPSHQSLSHIPTPSYAHFKRALVELVNDKSTLPKGGYLGCGLVHEYAYNQGRPINMLLDQLKGADQLLATICEELGLACSLTLLYRHLCDGEVNLITRSQYILSSRGDCHEGECQFLQNALRELTIQDVEGVHIVGDWFDSRRIKSFLRPYYGDPVTKILEIRTMSSVETETPYIYYGNEHTLDYFYGHASMLIAVDPAASRKELVL